MGGDSRLVGENVLTEQSCVVSDNVESMRSYSIAASALTSAGWAWASLSLWEERAAVAWRAAVTDNASSGVIDRMDLGEKLPGKTTCFSLSAVPLLSSARAADQCCLSR